jgi:non-structural maintenance of chromosomes element 1
MLIPIGEAAVKEGREFGRRMRRGEPDQTQATDDDEVEGEEVDYEDESLDPSQSQAPSQPQRKSRRRSRSTPGDESGIDGDVASQALKANGKRKTRG